MSALCLRDDTLLAAPEDGGTMVRAVGRVSSPRFIGRREELVALEAALERTMKGSARSCSSAGRRVSGRPD